MHYLLFALLIFLALPLGAIPPAGQVVHGCHCDSIEQRCPHASYYPEGNIPHQGLCTSDEAGGWCVFLYPSCEEDPACVQRAEIDECTAQEAQAAGLPQQHCTKAELRCGDGAVETCYGDTRGVGSAISRTGGACHRGGATKRIRCSG